ncbi:hypothetical protein QQ045_008331 [Rhodiola kirilowii]
MDFEQAFSVVRERIKQIEAHEIATKIIGFLLMSYGEEEMIRLARSSNQFIEKVVLLAKDKLHRLATNTPISDSSFDIPQGFNRLTPNGTIPNLDAHAFDELQNKTRSMSLLDHYDQERGRLNNFYSKEAFRNICWKRSRRSPSFSTKPCIYFTGGFCKNGNSCRFSHDQSSPESLSPIFDPSQFVNDELMSLHESLAKLEMEITDLLKTRRGEPIQITNLPMIYSMTYGKPLQADGYLTESQRNGKPGYGLTKLLGHMTNRLCMIERPNGQHSIILAEDIPKYSEYRSLRNSPGSIVSGSRKIYLTFLTESTFTEDDVAKYFSKFGKVEDVRIPCQKERNYAFVTFSSPQTVETILSQPNSHKVSGCDVLVKAYREKSKTPERRPIEHYSDTGSEFLSMLSGLEPTTLLKEKQFIKQYVQGVESQHLLEFQLARNVELPLDSGHQYCLSNSQNNHFLTNDATNHLVPLNT